MDAVSGIPGNIPAPKTTSKAETGDICETLVSLGYEARLWSFSAIDRYLDRDSLPFVLVYTDASLTELARLFENLRFPGAALADAAVESCGRDYLFRCPDSGRPEQPVYELLRFSQDWKTRRFYDPCGFYPLLRQFRQGRDAERKTPPEAGNGAPDQEVPPWWKGVGRAEHWLRAAAEGALILARYGPEPRQQDITEIAEVIRELPGTGSAGPEEQRLLLTALLDSSHPENGFEFLKAAGFVEKYWPELAALDDVDHAKEFHPEGNVWKHTLETFRYRKGGHAGHDPCLSLALLLHDSGKPLSESSGGHRFQAHAELGAQVARRFLGRLGFRAELINNVAWLVKNHMLPAAMPRLPLIRTQEIMEAPLFPALMELYRCDESSSFKGLDGYYESSAAYRQYLKHRRNPYRSADGKKTRGNTR
ncbi:MAG: HD domain-containing protein [Treponema sp.]|jgi:poly(A) polymerase|nr:HD domain-containing protein [Treponema sp.]